MEVSPFTSRSGHRSGGLHACPIESCSCRRLESEFQVFIENSSLQAVNLKEMSQFKDNQNIRAFESKFRHAIPHLCLIYLLHRFRLGFIVAGIVLF
jgi:hypothetical protein